MAAKLVRLDAFNIREDGSKEFLAPETVVAMLEQNEGTVFLSAYYGDTQGVGQPKFGHHLSPKNITIPLGQVRRLIEALEEVTEESREPICEVHPGGKEVNMGKQQVLDAIEGAIMLLNDEAGEDTEDVNSVIEALSDAKAWVVALGE